MQQDGEASFGSLNQAFSLTRRCIATVRVLGISWDAIFTQELGARKGL